MSAVAFESLSMPQESPDIERGPTQIDAVRASHAPAPEMPDLLRMFNEVSTRLSETHRRLEERVADLQRELAEAKDGLRRSRALAALGEMAAGIAHEVRNPLASIALHAEVLHEDLADRPVQQEILEKISRAVHRLDAIVGDVLRFARSARGDARLHPVIDSIAEALSACDAEVVRAGVTVECRVPDALPVLADPTLVVQALVNLVRNAVEAMSESDSQRRTLRIDACEIERLGPDGRRTRMTLIGVEDSGPGFDPALRPRAFTPFVTTRSQGTGLGLAIVHRIADAHGGAVRICDAPKGGARVEFLLPTAEGRAAATAGGDSRSESWVA